MAVVIIPADMEEQLHDLITGFRIRGFSGFIRQISGEFSNARAISTFAVLRRSPNGILKPFVFEILSNTSAILSFISSFVFPALSLSVQILLSCNAAVISNWKSWNTTPRLRRRKAYGLPSQFARRLWPATHPSPSFSSRSPYRVLGRLPFARASLTPRGKRILPVHGYVHIACG